MQSAPKFIKKLIAQKEKELEKEEREKSQPVLNNNNLPTPNVSSLGSKKWKLHGTSIIQCCVAMDTTSLFESGVSEI